MSMLITLKPRLSEKSYEQSKSLNTYTFEVPRSATKQSIAAAVKGQYEVTVTNVTTATIKGKHKRTFINRRGKYVSGERSDVKKAYVTLKDGDKLTIFAAEEEQEEKAKKATAKAAKKAAKASTKTSPRETK